MLVCTYPATLDVVVFLLQALLDAGFFFVCDENETPPFLRFGVDGKLDSFDLKSRDDVLINHSAYLQNLTSLIKTDYHLVDSVGRDKINATVSVVLRFYCSKFLLAFYKHFPRDCSMFYCQYCNKWTTSSLLTFFLESLFKIES